MKYKWKTVTCFLVALSMTTLLVIKGQKQSKTEDEPDLSQFPTLDYENRRAVNSSEKQQKRSKKYNSRGPVITEDKVSIFHIYDWDLRLPALPVKLSSAVIVGEVKDAQAHFSDDQTDVYSEFIVQVSEVLKNDDKAPLGVGNSVILERSGGRCDFHPVR